MKKSMIIALLIGAVLPGYALAQSADQLKNDDKTPGDVLTYGMGYSQNRFSTLTQINKDTVKRLVPAWSYSMADKPRHGSAAADHGRRRLHHRS